MPDVDLTATIVAALLTLLLGGCYYGLLGDRLARPRVSRPGWQVPVVEIARGLTLAAVVSGLAAYADVATATGGALLGLVLWVGLPLVLWTGAVFHEGVSPAQAAIHAGDWLVKLPAVGALVSTWP